MNIGILISGRGSNMAAIAGAVKQGTIPDSRVVVVISDNPGATGLRIAAEFGIETLTIQRKGRTREAHDGEIIAELRKRDVELVCLAGYMRLLSPGFVRSFPSRILNIHPSLLPAFPGLDAQRQALESGVSVTGCTVHFVDEELDHGPVILSREVPVFSGDTVESLSQRILGEEHAAYVEAVRRVVMGE